jgi:hypothetical protein
MGKQFTGLLENAFWIESSLVSEDERGALPPYEFCYNVETGKPAFECPIVFGDEVLIEMKAMYLLAVNAKAKKTKEKRKKSSSRLVIETDESSSSSDAFINDAVEGGERLTTNVVRDEELVMMDEEEMFVGPAATTEFRSLNARNAGEHDAALLQKAMDKEHVSEKMRKDITDNIVSQVHTKMGRGNKQK